MSRRIFPILYGCTSLVLIALPLGSLSPALAQKKPKEPLWTHAFDLSCRKFGEPAFTDKTQKFGVEVFNDTTTGQLIFICETGTISVAPAGKDVKAPTAGVKEPRWTHGLNVKARSHGENDFSEKTRVYGAEVFRDENVGVTLFVCETGAISAAPK